ncbi:hypothetical protein H6G76_25235 [Nostoc sp. FACHB-152]|uniref:beta strand repeat-containing protein n=1 Tax=unclassified Nostoc TaxID=2593658 RepID=UPI001684A8E5|nr:MULTISPECIES: hypothetical protein [unclassified Nostoc]MBD2450399.1 hypothetical protein [Nostoc sp. FACHB-152]MBD2471620.1 hypothetical protein [Nostoc sp. FACHB-145]
MKSRYSYKINKTKNRVFYRNLIAIAILSNGWFQFLQPVLAQTTSTAAGTAINNQATATYEDPNNPNVPINSTSNTVTVTIAEVAGISLVAGTPVDNNGGNLQAGDLVYFPFTITNVGNDPTRFQIPTQAGITGPGTIGTLQYNNNGTWTDVPAGGFTTSSIPVNGTVQVRVPVTINSGVTSGQQIKVTLGETNPTETASNSPRAGSVNDTRDVYTVDNPDGTSGEVAGTPVNGVVEGSTSATITIDPKYYSLATILKTRGVYSNNNTSADITDDTINYNLSLRVESTDVTGQSITPSPLAGSSLPGIPGTNILVSDAIPLGTQLAAAPTPPTGWQVVYSTTAVSTSANAATWTTTQPADLSTVTRVGFIKPTIDGDAATYLPADGQLTQFSIQVKIRTGQTAPLTIANIAQVFGKTPQTNTPVLDESGDANPSNFDGTPGNMTPPPDTDTNGDNVPDQLPRTVPDGYINDPTDLNTTGTDTAGNNTGDTNNSTANQGGEANVFTISLFSLLNGPNGFPSAVGPTNNNDDFTNKSSNVPANTTPGSTFDPNVVSFSNTVSNTGNQAANISLLPTPPANTADLPTGTIVTVSYNNGTTTISATYTYNGTTFAFTSGTGTVGGNPISATNPIRIDGVASNGTANYTVVVDLPAGTPLSTDTNIQRGFPVPITAFIDGNSNGLLDDGVTNISIDRVYTGYLQLIKQSRILLGTGPAVQGTDGTLSTTPKKPAPGNIIEYVIQYKNISESQPASGNNNVILNAGSVVITEDGTVAPNNWAKDNTPTNNVIDTSHVANSAQDSGGTITFFSGDPATTPATNATSGTTATTDVTKYVDTLTNPVAPGESGTFTFQRKVN